MNMAVAVALLTGGITLAVEYLVPWRTDSMPVREFCYVHDLLMHQYA